MKQKISKELRGKAIFIQEGISERRMGCFSIYHSPPPMGSGNFLQALLFYSQHITHEREREGQTDRGREIWVTFRRWEYCIHFPVYDASASVPFSKVAFTLQYMLPYGTVAFWLTYWHVMLNSTKPVGMVWHKKCHWTTLLSPQPFPTIMLWLSRDSPKRTARKKTVWWYSISKSVTFLVFQVKRASNIFFSGIK